MKFGAIKKKCQISGPLAISLESDGTLFVYTDKFMCRIVATIVMSGSDNIVVCFPVLTQEIVPRETEQHSGRLVTMSRIS